VLAVVAHLLDMAHLLVQPLELQTQVAVAVAVPVTQ
jgi:hypothetical protein